MPDRLVVRLHGHDVGRLRRGADGSRVRMSVDRDFNPDGVTLTESFTAIPGSEPSSDVVSNFLGGYVPEGQHRVVMASRRGIDATDLFALLREFGGSLPGAVTLRPEGDLSSQTPAWLEELTEAALGQLLRQALRDTDQAVPRDSRSTLPGFQPKVLVHRVAEGWAQPHGSAHSTYLLKPQVPQRATRLIDEHYGHLLAQAAGLAEFSSELMEADGVTFLAIQRFDRHIRPDGSIELVHQEDLAQALGLDWRTSDAKFQDPQWPDNPNRASAARIAQLLAAGPGGSSLVREWARRLVFSVVIGDNDAHAKNAALLHTAQGTAMAPAYDTVPGLFSPDMIDDGFRMAFAVNGTFDHRQMSVESLVAEAQSWNVMGSDLAAAAVEDAMAACVAAIRNVTPPAGISAGLVDKLLWTADRLSAGDAIGTPPWQRGE